MTDKEKYAVKMAADIMENHFNEHCNMVIGNRGAGVMVGYGEAINILLGMLLSGNNHNCNCQHNSNSRDNEPCCRCDSITANMNKAKVDSLEIIARMLDDKPYYELKYRRVGEKDYSVGYSSYNLKLVLSDINTYFEIVENNDKQTNADRIKNMSDEELAEFLVGFKNTFGKEYEGEASCMEWLQSEAKETATNMENLDVRR